MTAPNPILRRWQTLGRLPLGLGPLAFDVVLRRMVPYTGTVRPRVRELRPGFARVEMRDRRRVRNHLQSIHAIALMNLAEVTSGLAMTCSLPESARAIVTRLSIDYHKKARGSLTATCTCAAPDTSTEHEIDIEAEIRDAAGDVVATATARWHVGPRT